MQNLSLPIDDSLAEIETALVNSSVVALNAEPGAGKTTRVPAYLANIYRTLVLQPRRLATQLTAARVADQQGWQIGDEIGVLTRFDHSIAEHSQLVFATEAMLPKLMTQNITLDQYDLIIIDEFHERNLYTDYNLALINWLLTRNKVGFKLLIMSATLDQSAIDRYFEGRCSWVFVEGRKYPVDISYHPEYAPDQPGCVAQAILALLNKTSLAGDILVFLTGRDEIEKVKYALSKFLDSSIFEVLQLYAGLSVKKQRLVFSGSGKRRVILSTNVSETSITIDSVSAVIDTGRAKQSNFARWSGLSTLKTEKISQFSCIQRAGRAGRTRHGVCWRLYSEDDFNRRLKDDLPELLRVDLCSILLDSKYLLPDNVCFESSLFWMNPLPKKHVEYAQKFLSRIGALDRDGSITDLGRSLVPLGLHPRLGVILLHAKDHHILPQAALLCALIGEDMLLKNHYSAVDTSSCDVIYQANILLKILKNEDHDHQQISHMIDYSKVDRIQKVYRQLAKRLRLVPLEKVMIENSHHFNLKGCMLAGFFDRVAKYRPSAKPKRGLARQYFHFCQGGGGVLSEASTLQKNDFVIVLAAHEDLNHSNAGLRIKIHAASSISSGQLEQINSMISSECIIEASENAAVFIEEVSYGSLMLARHEKAISEEQRTSFFVSILKQRWPFPFKSAADLDEYHEKIRLMEHYNLDHDFPRFEGDLLDLLIEDMCSDAKNFNEIASKPLSFWILRQLNESQAHWLDHLFPSVIKIDGLKPLPVVWKDGRFTIEAKLQRFFSLKKHPAILEGHHPLCVVLLAPNGRPAQITEDIKGFWQGSYQLVRKELKRRYPKHDWPEKI